MKFLMAPASQTKEFRIDAPEKRDIGAWRVRLSKPDRLGGRRHCLLRISNGDETGYFIGLGHDKGDGVIQMDLDVRDHLGVTKNDRHVILNVELIQGWRSSLWYWHHRDPQVHVPAKIALWSLFLGSAGILLGTVSIGLTLCGH